MMRVREGARRAVPVVGGRSRPRPLTSARGTSALAAVFFAALLTTAAMPADRAVDARVPSATAETSAVDQQSSGADGGTIWLPASTTRQVGPADRLGPAALTENELLRVLSIIPAIFTSIVELPRLTPRRIGLMRF